jgi:sulfoxide reductase heme-binding subunit YedZ
VRWRRLHTSVYAVACLAILHFLWMRAGKNDFAEVALYGALLATLLASRILQWAGKRQKSARSAIIQPVTTGQKRMG